LGELRLHRRKKSSIKMAAFRAVAPYIPVEVYRRSDALIIRAIMEAATAVNIYRTTRRNSAVHSNLHTCRHEKLKYQETQCISSSNSITTAAVVVLEQW
jgi:hypothetical protein